MSDNEFCSDDSEYLRFVIPAAQPLADSPGTDGLTVVYTSELCVGKHGL